MVLFQQPLLTFSNPSINRTPASLWDYEDEFTSDVGWSVSGTGNQIDTGSGEADFDCERATTEGLSLDLQDADAIGSNLSDTAWVAEWHGVNYTSMTANMFHIFLMHTADRATTYFDNGDGIGIGFRRAVDSLYDEIVSHDVLAGDGDGTQTIYTPYTWTLATDYYIQIIRQSATTYDCLWSENSDFSSPLLDQNSIAVDSGVGDLRYTRINSQQDGSSGRTAVGTVEMHRISDGVTTPPS